MTIKQEFLKFKEVLNIMLKSGFLFTKHSEKINNFKIYDIYYMLMGVKELIRNLEQVYLSKFGKIYVYVENRYIKSIAMLLLNELEFANKHLSFIDLSRNIKKSNNGISMLLVIGSPNKRFFLEALRNQVHFIHVINDESTQKLTGIYHMNNDVSTITKIVFLFALIDQIFANTVKNINQYNA